MFFILNLFQASYEEFMVDAQATASRGMYSRIDLERTK